MRLGNKPGPVRKIKAPTDLQKIDYFERAIKEVKKIAPKNKYPDWLK